MTGVMLLSVTYGFEIQQENNPHIKKSEAVVLALAAALVPGTFLVDVLPILKYVPAWFPGASFQRKAREWRTLVREIVETPYAEVKKDRVSTIIISTQIPIDQSMVNRSLEKVAFQWFQPAYKRLKKERKMTLSPRRLFGTQRVAFLQVRFMTRWILCKLDLCCANNLAAGSDSVSVKAQLSSS